MRRSNGIFLPAMLLVGLMILSGCGSNSASAAPNQAVNDKQGQKVEIELLLVTDAISATDMPDGAYILGTDTVNVVNGICRDAEGRLAGSTLTQEIALRNRLPVVNLVDYTLTWLFAGVVVAKFAKRTA